MGKLVEDAAMQELTLEPGSIGMRETQRSLRLLHVIDTFSPARGGPPEAVRQLVIAYLEAGTHIEVLCLDRPDAAYLTGINCPVHALGQSFLGRYAFSSRLWRWLHENSNRYDGIIMNGIWSFPGFAIRIAARRSGTPYGIFVHGALDPWFNRMYPLKHLKKILYWPVQHAVLRDAAAVFFTSSTEERLARSSFRPSQWKSVVIPYGIADSMRQPAECDRQIERFYRELPKLYGRRYLLFLSRIHEKKGCDLLIKAFARVASSVPDVDVVMAGPDQMGMQASLRKLAERLGVSDRVHWPGLISGDLKWGALRACEAFILPSHQENFGIVVAEALSASRPVLISNQVNIWPDVQSDGVGLVEEDTLEGTERLMRRFFDLPPAEREAMSARARSCYLSRYAMSRAALAINEIFREASPAHRASEAVSLHRRVDEL